ncbi:MAG: hypothetical protein AB1450_08390 [Pseudomonadota bacterium]
MTNHPNRNWRSRWVVDLEAATAIHQIGLVVRFAPAEDEPGTYDGEVIAGLEALAGMDGQALARLMREAGDIYMEARHGRH